MDISTLGFTAVPAITVICLLAAQAIKATSLDAKWLPVVCGCLGAILGVVEYAIDPVTISGNIISAVAIGIVSGLAATGVNQVFKQLSD